MSFFFSIATSQILCISNTGSNDNTGTKTDPVLPSYLNNYPFKGNEKILFNKGETFDISQTITVDQPSVKFGAYGSGARPILRASVAITGFTDEGGGIYSKVMSEPDWLFNGGSEMKLAETEWIETTASTATNKLTIAHAAVSGFASIVGSKVIYKSRRWKVDPYTVQAYDGTGVITLTTTLISAYEADRGLKLLGKKDYFSGNDEWAYESGTLYVKSASTPTVRQNALTNLFDVQAANITFEDLDISEVFGAGIMRTSGNKIYISNCSVHDIRGVGIALKGFVESATVINSEVYNCSFKGIVSNTTHVPVIYSNEVYNINKASNYGYRTDTELSNPSNGIEVHANNGSLEFSDGGIIYDNVVYNCAYNGIALRGQNNLIEDNYVHDCMERFGDGGGIYGFGGNVSAEVIDFTGNTIRNNIVKDCLGAWEGLFAAAPVGDSKGIYLDNESIVNTVDSNVVENCPTGILTNRGTKENILTDNIVVKCSVRQIEFQSGRSIDDYPVNEGNTFNGNVMACGVSTAYCLVTELEEADADYNPFSASDNNHYIQPYAMAVLNDANAGDRTLVQLRTLYGTDVSSTSKTNWITPPGVPATDLILYTNPTNAAVNQLIPAGYEDVNGNDISGTTQSIPAYYGLLIIKT